MFSIGYNGLVASGRYNHTIRHEMLWGGDRVELNIFDMMRVPMMTLFRTNDRSDLTKEWANISGMVRLHELETRDGASYLKKY